VFTVELALVLFPDGALANILQAVQNELLDVGALPEDIFRQRSFDLSCRTSVSVDTSTLPSICQSLVVIVDHPLTLTLELVYSLGPYCGSRFFIFSCCCCAIKRF
jgi:hypothetical protein